MNNVLGNVVYFWPVVWLWLVLVYSISRKLEDMSSSDVSIKLLLPLDERIHTFDLRNKRKMTNSQPPKVER